MKGLRMSQDWQYQAANYFNLNNPGINNPNESVCMLTY